MKFTDAEIVLIVRVLDTIRGTIQQVGHVYAIRSVIIEQGKEDIAAIPKESLTLMANIVMTCNQYTVADLPIVSSIVGKLEPILKPEEPHGPQAPE